MRKHHECEGRIEKSTRRIVVWHHEACGGMTNGDPEGQIFYYPALTQIMDFFLAHHFFYLSIDLYIYLLIYFKISSQKVLNTLRCNFT